MRLSVGRRIGGVWLGASFRPQLGRKQKTTRYWTHDGCPIHHQRQDTAEACAKRTQEHTT
jgi:hypothetical protein